MHTQQVGIEYQICPGHSAGRSDGTEYKVVGCPRLWGLAVKCQARGSYFKKAD